MEKKILITLLLIFLVSIPIVFSGVVPQFLLFQGEARLDGRIDSGYVINFSVNRTELDSDFTDENGNYEIFIQGHENYYGWPINITINNYEAEQEISYNYPQDIFLNLSALTEKALNITKSFPTNNTIEIQKAGELSFNITTYSGHSDIVNHTWFLDREKINESFDTTLSSFIYEIKNNDTGTYNITFIATDGFLTVSKEWTLIIQRPETQNFDGDTTNFDSLGLDELGNVENVVLEKTGEGKIEFLQDLNLSGVTDLNNKVRIENGVVAIDTSFYPQLDKPARITLTGLSYNTIPKIFYSDGFTTIPSEINKKCDFCNLISYTNFPTNDGTVVFEVEHFSSFKAGDSGNKYNLDLFDDLDTCKSGVIGDLDINMKEPDEGDEFGIGDKIEIEIKVENNADEDKDIVVEVALYNIDEDDVEEEVDDEKEIRDGRDETFKFIFDVPDDFEDDDYLVYVKVYEEGDEESQCVEGAIEIDLEREKHDVIIKSVSISPEKVYAGQNLNVFTEVQNIGKNDEDVYVVVEIKELDVSTESETFELEEFGEDDSFSETFSIKIPGNAEEGEYEVEIKVVFDGEENEKKETISVLEKVPIQMEPIDLTIKETPKIEKIPKVQEALEISSAIPIVLSIGILILIVLIVVVSVRRGK